MRGRPTSRLSPDLAVRSSRGGGPRRARRLGDALDDAGGVEAGLTLAVAQRAGAERGVGPRVVAGVGGEGASVSGGVVDGRRGREVQVRCQSRERESRRGGRAWPTAAGFPFFKGG
jgi:hypothetical protein